MLAVTRKKSRLISWSNCLLVNIALLPFGLLSQSLDTIESGVIELEAFVVYEGLIDVIDGFTGKVMLPIGAFLVAVFVGWRADRRLVSNEAGLQGGLLALWRFLICWAAPIAVFLVLLFGLFPGLLGD